MVSAATPAGDLRPVDNPIVPIERNARVSPELARYAERDPFEALVAAALEGLPAPFRDRLDTVAVVIEEEPTPAELAQTGAPGLLGLYTGVPRTAYGASDAVVPSRITIYRGPHLRIFRDPDALARGVTATVRHEVAHHLGISDARLAELGRDRTNADHDR
jgi:predicted Zn-dependent protease with MMP-like domain